METNDPGSLVVAVVGLRFGADFAPIYLHHPDVADVVVCDRDADRLRPVADRFGIHRTASSLTEILADDSIDAVHLATGIPDHAAHAVATIEAGKHCACTVPMAVSIDDLRRIVDATRRTGRRYMMMETAVYHRAFLYALEMADSDAFGPIQFLRGAHYQDMENWPPYWVGLPPMWYATHAISPLLWIAGTRATRVRCLGSGTMRPELHAQYGNRFPVESALFELDDRPYAAEVTRSLFHCAREYSESFTVYGGDRSFEWQQIEAEAPVVYQLSPLGEGEGARKVAHERVALPDYGGRLPPSIARFTRSGIYDPDDPHGSFVHGGGHGGSHPHLGHEFVRCIVEDRPSSIDAVTAANWTAAGICAHMSAERGGDAVEIPRFDG